MSIEARHQRGVTLIELVIFIVIVGAALAGILRVLSLTSAASADPLRTKQALMIAEGLLEEVQLAGFTYCDPSDAKADSAASSAACTIPENWGQSGAEPAGARPYDNVNDYVSQANTASAAFDNGGVLADANGRALNVNGYTARLTILPEAIGPAGAQVGAAGSAADTDMLRIRVEVFYDNAQSVVLDGYRARYAPNPA